jgi:hypothetical protein
MAAPPDSSSGAPGRTRRRLLADAARLALLGPALVGARGASDLVVGHLDVGGNWNPRPTALRRLLWELTQRTSVEAALEPVAVKPEAPELFRFPMLYRGGSGAPPRLGEEAVRRLRRHLTYGGTMIIDSADAEPGGPFDRAIREELSRLFPRAELERLPEDHVVFKAFYLVDHQAGRTLRVPHLEGLRLEDRFAVIYSQNDLAGAWARDAFGRWEHEVTPGGERQREMAFRLGINLAMYALCLDYKDDLVHTPFILKRRQ